MQPRRIPPVPLALVVLALALTAGCVTVRPTDSTGTTPPPVSAATPAPPQQVVEAWPLRIVPAPSEPAPPATAAPDTAPAPRPAGPGRAAP
ncbi:hypothetical protein ACFWG9_07840, partial [Streptomyces sp. NPDC060333]